MSSRRKLFVFFFLVNSHSLAIPRWQSAIFRSLGAIIRVTLPTANSVCTWGCKQRQVGQEKTKPRCVYDFNETQLKVCVIKAQGITNLGVRCTGASEHNSGGGAEGYKFFFFQVPVPTNRIPRGHRRWISKHGKKRMCVHMQSLCGVYS